MGGSEFIHFLKRSKCPAQTRTISRSKICWSSSPSAALISLNGFVRATDDVDILVDKSPQNLGRLLHCLGQWGAGFARKLKIEDFTDDPGALRVMEDFDLDIFVQMREKSLDYFRPRLCFIEIDKARIPYLFPTDLIFLKQDSWREKDRVDVAAMKEILSRDS